MGVFLSSAIAKPFVKPVLIAGYIFENYYNLIIFKLKNR